MNVSVKHFMQMKLVFHPLPTVQTPIGVQWPQPSLSSKKLMLMKCVLTELFYDAI